MSHNRKKNETGRDRPPPVIALRRRQGSNPDLLAESEIHCHICFRTEVAISQQPASLANVLVYKIHTPIKATLQSSSAFSDTNTWLSCPIVFQA